MSPRFERFLDYTFEAVAFTWAIFLWLMLGAAWGGAAYGVWSGVQWLLR